MKMIIDRFEGDFAIVELGDKERADMPRKLLPEGAKEGDCIDVSIDRGATKARKEKIQDLMGDLFEG